MGYSMSSPFFMLSVMVVKIYLLYIIPFFMPSFILVVEFLVVRIIVSKMHRKPKAVWMSIK